MSLSEIRRCAFVVSGDTPWRCFLVQAKQTLMRWQGLVYPDVYSLPRWLGSKRLDFLAVGQKIEVGRYDYIFTELNAGVEQIRYPLTLMEHDHGKVVVIPGPPELFPLNASPEANQWARRLLGGAGQVWAYAPEVAAFADELAQAEVARVIPWPFDYAATRHLGLPRRSRSSRIRVLLGVPLHFEGIAANNPQFLEECIVDALADLSQPERERFQFLGMVYTREDELAWRRSGFGKKIGAVLEPKMLYHRFVRFLGSVDAVITLPRFTVLGRIAFLAAALGKPGIFTDNVALHRRLYPQSLVQTSADEGLRELVRELLLGLLKEEPLTIFQPEEQAARQVGDFEKNAVVVRQMLER